MKNRKLKILLLLSTVLLLMLGNTVLGACSHLASQKDEIKYKHSEDCLIGEQYCHLCYKIYEISREEGHKLSTGWKQIENNKKKHVFYKNNCVKCNYVESVTKSECSYMQPAEYMKYNSEKHYKYEICACGNKKTVKEDHIVKHRYEPKNATYHTNIAECSKCDVRGTISKRRFT